MRRQLSVEGVEQRTPDMQRQVRPTGDKHLKSHLVGVYVGSDFEPLDVVAGPWLQEHRLPNSTRATVPTPLLTDRLVVILHRVLNPQHDRAAQPTISSHD